MNTDILLGIAVRGFGLYTLYVRATNPSKFGKLDAMKQKWGSTAGTIVHVVAYSVLPIVAGVIFLYVGLSAA